jgi:hypothetical protein
MYHFASMPPDRTRTREKESERERERGGERERRRGRGRGRQGERASEREKERERKRERERECVRARAPGRQADRQSRAGNKPRDSRRIGRRLRSFCCASLGSPPFRRAHFDCSSLLDSSRRLIGGSGGTCRCLACGTCRCLAFACR